MPKGQTSQRDNVSRSILGWCSPEALFFFETDTDGDLFFPDSVIAGSARCTNASVPGTLPSGKITQKAMSKAESYFRDNNYRSWVWDTLSVNKATAWKQKTDFHSTTSQDGHSCFFARCGVVHAIKPPEEKLLELIVASETNGMPCCRNRPVHKFVSLLSVLWVKIMPGCLPLRFVQWNG